MFLKCALCGGDWKGKGDKGKGGKWDKNKEKIKQCMHETKELMKCCPFPENDDTKNDPDCKHHLEGIENKEKDHKEKHKAHSCFTECLFKKKEILKENGELDKEKLKAEIKEFLGESKAGFQEISFSSVDYCISECKGNFYR